MTLTFVRSGKTNFSESLAPAVYGSTNRRRRAFSDLLGVLTLMLILLSVSFYGHLFVMQHVVVTELFAAGVNAPRLVCQSLAAYHFVLELDVFQLVFQLGCVGAFDHVYSLGEFYVERQVVVKGLGVENAVVG